MGGPLPHRAPPPHLRPAGRPFRAPSSHACPGHRQRRADHGRCRYFSENFFGAVDYFGARATPTTSLPPPVEVHPSSTHGSNNLRGASQLNPGATRHPGAPAPAPVSPICPAASQGAAAKRGGSYFSERKARLRAHSSLPSLLPAPFLVPPAGVHLTSTVSECRTGGHSAKAPVSAGIPCRRLQAAGIFFGGFLIARWTFACSLLRFPASPAPNSPSPRRQEWI